MSSKQPKKGLGRGFDSLIPSDLLDESFDPTAGDDNKVSELRHIKLSEIETDPDQPRKNFNEAGLRELAASIERHGVLQPIIVTAQGGSYRVVAGERRLRAATMAGQTTIPALVRTLTDQHRLELALIENLQRHDLNALETATAYLKLRDQFNLTLEEIGKTIGGKSISAVSNTLRLLRLPKTVQHEVAAGTLSEGQARPLIDADPALVEQLLPRILKENWTARRIEQAVREHKVAKKSTGSTPPSVIYEGVTQKIGAKLGTNVRITSTARGSGQVLIAFKDADELERITKAII